MRHPDIDAAIRRAESLTPEQVANLLTWAACQDPAWIKRNIGLDLSIEERAGWLALAIRLGRRAGRGEDGS